MFSIAGEEGQAKLLTIMRNISGELQRAEAKYPDDPMLPSEPKVALKTIKAELAELDRELERSTLNPEALFKEALQTASMSVKFLLYVALPLLEQANPPNTLHR